MFCLKREKSNISRISQLWNNEGMQRQRRASCTAQRGALGRLCFMFEIGEPVKSSIVQKVKIASNEAVNWSLLWPLLYGLPTPSNQSQRSSGRSVRFVPGRQLSPSVVSQ